HIYIRDSAVGAICHGASLTIPGVIQFSKDIDKNVIIAIFTMKGEFIALAKGLMTSKKISELKNGICATPIAVFMEKNTYPSSWKSL
ncbi:MAG: RNA-guided pseudouridylation complex pseudouridine synthase subunit Cbf5, partial [Candidatus Heimdallarchaeota archaeon]|nr:RNA-guided pseudouridylation complex pseudouridine synthase subunit Cbf5 [Candidatus Heimdallarchaeota archaeon]